MKKITAVSALTLATLIGAALAVPATASAHGIVTERTVKVFETDRHHGGHKRHWKHHRRAGRHHGHRHHGRHHRDRREYVYVEREYRRAERAPRPVERHRDYRTHRDDGIKVHIDYDFRL